MRHHLATSSVFCGTCQDAQGGGQQAGSVGACACQRCSRGGKDALTPGLAFTPRPGWCRVRAAKLAWRVPPMAATPCGAWTAPCQPSAGPHSLTASNGASTIAGSSRGASMRAETWASTGRPEQRRSAGGQCSPPPSTPAIEAPYATESPRSPAGPAVRLLSTCGGGQQCDYGGVVLMRSPCVHLAGYRLWLEIACTCRDHARATGGHTGTRENMVRRQEGMRAGGAPHHHAAEGAGASNTLRCFVCCDVEVMPDLVMPDQVCPGGQGQGEPSQDVADDSISPRRIAVSATHGDSSQQQACVRVPGDLADATGGGQGGGSNHPTGSVCVCNRRQGSPLGHTVGHKEPCLLGSSAGLRPGCTGGVLLEGHGSQRVHPTQVLPRVGPLETSPKAHEPRAHASERRTTRPVTCFLAGRLSLHTQPRGWYDVSVSFQHVFEIYGKGRRAPRYGLTDALTLGSCSNRASSLKITALFQIMA
eukprot:jgi/Mesvir1/9003/Mv21292-RA.2